MQQRLVRHGPLYYICLWTKLAARQVELPNEEWTSKLPKNGEATERALYT